MKGQAAERRQVRIAAIADIHCDTDQRNLEGLFLQIADQVDVLLLCGDLTDHGLPEEARSLAHQLRSLNTAVVAVLGNHDHDAGQQAEVAAVLSDAGVRLLDGDACTVCGIGFAGVKGFAGGFGRRALAPWGEQAIKDFVQVGWNETQKLDSALARLDTPQRIVLLHYAPIAATVEGEPPEVFPFLGSSHLEEPINRHGVRAVFHGHAHHGTAEGRTQAGVPVYNVSMPLLMRLGDGQLPVRFLALDVAGTEPCGEPESPKRRSKT